MNTKDFPQLGSSKPPSERGKFPARLHVLLARNAKVGLVIRRGPSKSVCTVLWDRKRDKFKLGHPPDYFGGECLNVYYNRLKRDGWVMHGEEVRETTVFEKKLPKSWTLRKLAFSEIGAPPSRGCYWDAHELRQDTKNTVLAFPEWEWADYVDGRLVFAVEGQLRSAQLGRGKISGEKLLHDFNDMKFEAIAAPY
jgi:hypothetical protein